MFCTKCGNKLQPGVKFCNSCGNEVNTNVLNSNVNENKKEQVKPIPIVCIVSYLILALIILLHISFGLKFNNSTTIYMNKLLETSKLFSYIISVIYIIGLILMIIANVSYNKNKHSNILMVLYIVFGIIIALELCFIYLFDNACLCLS